MAIASFRYFLRHFFRAAPKASRRMGQGRIFVLELPYNSIRGLGYFFAFVFRVCL